MTLTAEKLMKLAGELAVLKVLLEEENARLTAENAELRGQIFTQAEPEKAEMNGLALCTE